jgi:hypothetical protein
VVLLSTHRESLEAKWDPRRIQLDAHEGQLVRLS